MAVDLKYGKVKTEFGSIGEEEPVVVFRAKDICLPDVLAYYAARCIKVGSPDHHIALITKSRREIIDWQNAKGVRVPRSDSFPYTR